MYIPDVNILGGPPIIYIFGYFNFYHYLSSLLYIKSPSFDSLALYCQDILVCNQNQGSVSRMETKVQFWYPQRSQNFFFKTKTFFFKKFQFLFNISHDFPLYTRFYKLEKNQVLKNNLKIFNIWQQIWFFGPFYDGKNTLYY